MKLDDDAETTEIVADLLRWEGFTLHLYRDSAEAGHVTIGIGNLLRTVEDAQRLPFLMGSRRATPTEVAEGFAAVRAMPRALAAGAYAKATPIRLSTEAVMDLTRARLAGEFLPGLRKLFPGFDGFPRAAKRALIDMAWNLGIGGLGKFSKLGAAVARRDWRAAALSCSRKTSREVRNAWTQARFLEAAVATEAPRT